jgi:hypothetical protein
VKPLPPTKPLEKLPLTYNVGIVTSLDGIDRMHSVVLTEMQGAEVKRRKVLVQEPDINLALDELNRTAMRVFLFSEGAELVA